MLLRTANIIKPHGLKGEVKVFLITDNQDRFVKNGEVFWHKNEFVENCDSCTNLTIQWVKPYKKNIIIIKFFSINSIDDCQNLIGGKLFANVSSELDPKSPYYFEILDKEVKGENLDFFTSGKVSQIIQRPIQDLIEVTDIGDKKTLIPFNERFITVKEDAVILSENCRELFELED